MNINQLFEQFQNKAEQFQNKPANASHLAANSPQTTNSKEQSGLSELMNKIPSGGLASGAAAGGVMALLMSNKSARKVAGKAAGYGSAALLGGLAFKAFNQWKGNNASPQNAGTAQANGTAQGNGVTAGVPNTPTEPSLLAINDNAQPNPEFQLTLIKSMIAASKADGHIDDAEQKVIFEAINTMNLSNADKAMLYGLMRQPIYIQELTLGADTLEQKSEVYLASCIAIENDTQAEEQYLQELAQALDIPHDLAMQLRQQVH